MKSTLKDVKCTELLIDIATTAKLSLPLRVGRYTAIPDDGLAGISSQEPEEVSRPKR
jgi:hypothetical protein